MMGAVALSLWAQGLAGATAGDWERVERDLSPIAQLTLSMEPFEPMLAAFLPDYIEATISQGKPQTALPFVELLEERGRTLDRAWALGMAARCRALLLSGSGDLARAVQAADVAVEQLARVPVPLELGRALLIKGQIHRRMKEKRVASDSLSRAVAIFTDRGARLWAEKARAELARVGLRPRASTDLTPTEARVAELAGAGLTNRQVAEAAFMTPKSVESVISRIYRKLGISSRAELGSKVAQTPESHGPS